MKIDQQNSRRSFITSASLVAAASGIAAVTGNAAFAKPESSNGIASAKPLLGRTAFITGAARGIGLAIAETYAKAGANVAMIDIADPTLLNSTAGYRVANADEFEQAFRQVKSHGTKVLKIQADVRDLDALNKASLKTVSSFGGIDIVVANAGYVAWHSFENGTPKQWHDVFDVNVHGVFNTAKATIPALKKSKYARIINLASIGGRAGSTGNGAYTSSKWAVIGLTKQAANELGQYNITVNAISPGPVNTPMYRSQGQMKSMGAADASTQDAMLNPMLPVGDNGALDAQDIADTALFLASDAAKTISGTAIDVALGYNANYTA